MVHIGVWPHSWRGEECGWKWLHSGECDICKYSWSGVSSWTLFLPMTLILLLFIVIWFHLINQKPQWCVTFLSPLFRAWFYLACFSFCWFLRYFGGVMSCVPPGACFLLQTIGALHFMPCLYVSSFAGYDHSVDQGCTSVAWPDSGCVCDDGLIPLLHFMVSQGYPRGLEFLLFCPFTISSF